MSINEYKMFSRAAQDAGINDKDERKLIAMDPGILLEESSPDFQKQINPETLKEFFEFLNDGSPDDGKSAIRLGNLLYQYRSDKRAEDNLTASGDYSPKHLNVQDKKIINLGCHLLEQSFYSGGLVDLNNKSAAAAAFIINNLAKIFQSQKDLTGFDKEKFADFIEKVSRFEEKKLVEKYVEPDSVNKKTKGLENLRQMVSQECLSLKEFTQNDWREYTLGLNERFTDALEVLCRLNYLDYSAQEIFQKKFRAISMSSSEIFRVTNNYAKGVLEGGGRGDSSSDKLDNYFKNTELSLYKLSSVLNGESYTPVDGIKWRLADLKKKLKPEISEKPKKYNDLSSFGIAESEKLAPGAIKVFEEIFENNGQGIFNQYILQIKKTENLKNQQTKIVAQDHNFLASREQILKKLGNPSAIPYFFKSFLVAADLRYQQHRGTEVLKESANSSQNKTEEHLFSDAYNIGWEGEIRKIGPNYANVHYLSGDMPLAVWSVEYLESLKKE